MLWAAAAGGGVWRTDKALSGSGVELDICVRRGSRRMRLGLSLTMLLTPHVLRWNRRAKCLG